MALEALVETGIGATRALVLDGDRVVEAHFEREDAGPLPGLVTPARLKTVLVPGRRGIVELPDGGEALIEPLPPLPQGARLTVEIVRAALPEKGRPRLPKARASEAQPGPAPTLAQRLATAGHRVVPLGGLGLDRLDAAGWGDAVAEAESGLIAFPGGMLTVSPTPALTVIDVDGPGDLSTLALAAADAAAAAIRRLGIGGPMVIDFPTLSGKAARHALDARLEAVLPPPFEKTAINGFGLVQVIRPRPLPSLLEQVRAPGFAALELLRRAGRHIGAPTLTAHPQLIAWLQARPALLERLARRTGGMPVLAADPMRPISAGDVH